MRNRCRLRQSLGISVSLIPLSSQRAIRRTCEWKARKLRRSRCSRHCKPRRVGCYRKIAHRHELSTRGCSDTVNAGNYRLGDLREDDHLARERIKSLARYRVRVATPTARVCQDIRFFCRQHTVGVHDDTSLCRAIADLDGFHIRTVGFICKSSEGFFRQ